VQLSGYVPEGALARGAATAEVATAIGMRRIWSGELAHDPFLPLAFAAQARPGLGVGTGIAVAFARSPFVTAETAWDLQRLSEGQFVLGLGTQVRAHVERRFGIPWSSPLPWMREYVGALRAIFATWQDGAPFGFEGERYRLDLIAPNFDPGPCDHGPPPIYLSGVGRHGCRLAGEVADGFITHSFHSTDYLEQVVLPALAEHGRRVTVVAAAWAAFGRDDEELERSREELRAKIGFYASTPSYRPVLSLHGLDALGERLSLLARARRFDDLAREVPDDVLGLFGVIGPPGEVGRALRERYAGIADEVALIHPVDAGTEADWVELLAGFAAATPPEA
jgi:probable F420-dependent oxidoreductase